MSKDVVSVYGFGPLNVHLDGEDRYLEHFKKEFHSKVLHKDERIDLSISISSDVTGINETHYVGKKTHYFNSNQVVVDRSAYFSYVIEDLFNKDKPTRLSINVKKAGFLRSFIAFAKGVLGVEFSGKHKHLKTIVATYNVLWSIIAIELLKHKCAFIHAGVVSEGDRAYLLSGTGGCGKTSTVMSLVENNRMDFLAEDFAIIDETGKAYFSPKSVSFYESDFSYGGEMPKKVKSIMSRVDRIKWFLLTKALGINPLIKVPPKQVFCIPSNLESPKSVEHFCYIRRVKSTELTNESISSEEYGERSSWASIREMMPFLETLCGLQANKDLEQLFLTPEQIRIEMAEIYTAAAKNRKVSLLSVPLNFNPGALREKIVVESND